MARGEEEGEKVGCRDVIREHGGAGWFTRLMIRRPITVASVCFGIILFFSVVAFVAYPLELQTGGGAWYPRESEVGRREDGLARAEEGTVFNPNSTDPASIVTATQRSRSEVITIFYWREDGGNILTTEGLAKMREVEQYVYNREGFSDVCLLNDDGVCYQANSLTLYAYSPPVASCSAYRNPNGSATSQWSSDVSTMLDPILNSSLTEVYCTGCGTGCEGQGSDALDNYVTTSFDADTMFSFAAKSSIRFGLPLAGYSNAYDRRKEQIDKVEDFIRDLTEALVEDGFSSDGITVRGLNGALLEAHFNKLLLGDAIWVLLSILLVGVFILLHTQAPLMAGFGILHVVLSFPFSYFFLQLFFDIGALGVLNFLGIFIILGIGADDIFILLDAWKQSENAFANLADGADSAARSEYLAERLHWTYLRASGAMLVTSLTTSAAFMMNIVSSVIPIQIFGIQVAFMVMANYVFVITYYPALMVVWEWYRIHQWCKPSKCKKGEGSGGAGAIVPSRGLGSPLRNESEQPLRGDSEDGARVFHTVDGDDGQIESGNGPAGGKDKEHHAVHNIHDYRPLERFLHNVWGPAMNKARWGVVAGFVAWVILCAVYAAEIEVSSEPAKWVPDSDPVQQMLNLQRENFYARYPEQVAVLAGLDEISRRGTNRFNAEDIGNAMYVQGFNMSSELAQQTYVDNCNTIINSWEYVKSSSAQNSTGVLCPMIEFKNYVENNLGGTFPVPAADFIDTLINYTAWVESNEGPGIDASLYTTLDERSNRRQAPMGIQQTIRWLKGAEPPQLVYLVTVINTTLIPQSSASSVEPVYEYFERATENLATAPGYQTTFQTTNMYLWMRLEQGLVKDATFSIFISLFLAFVIVTISTKSIVMSLTATVCIGLIVVTVMANMVWMGWKISIIESICLTVLVGLSVDYTIHIANSWMNGDTMFRPQRLNGALLEIGISVLAAAATTILSALPLLLTVIIFFYRFGVFIVLNVLYSTIYAFALFVALLVIFGPVSNRNDFYWLWLKVQGKDTSPAYRQPSDSSAGPRGDKAVTPAKEQVLRTTSPSKSPPIISPIHQISEM